MIRVLGQAAAVLAIASVVVTAQVRPLPAFTAISPLGVRVTSGQLNGAERWLLLYVDPDAIACQRLLQSLDAWVGADGPRVVVVAAGTEAAAAQVRLLLTQSAAAVYVDPDGSAGRALEITSVPALMGVSHGALDWKVQGVLNDPQMVEPIVRRWLSDQQ